MIEAHSCSLVGVTIVRQCISNWNLHHCSKFDFRVGYTVKEIMPPKLASKLTSSGVTDRFTLIIAIKVDKREDICASYQNTASDRAMLLSNDGADWNGLYVLT